MNPLRQRTSSAAWVRGIAELFAAEGLPVQALCAQADIDLESLQHPHTRVDVDRVSRLCEAAAQHYFRVGVDRLAPIQAARLAVMLPAPKRFEKLPRSGYVMGRAGTIAARMRDAELP